MPGGVGRDQASSTSMLCAAAGVGSAVAKARGRATQNALVVIVLRSARSFARFLHDGTAEAIGAGRVATRRRGTSPLRARDVSNKRKAGPALHYVRAEV